jgi:hypothetical protein
VNRLWRLISDSISSGHCPGNRPTAAQMTSQGEECLHEMNRHHIDDVAGFAPVGGGGCFISGEVDGVEHVPKKVHPVGRGRIERRLKARR